MILAMSQTQTSLWDQIEYVGAPSEFAWVLPIKGQVEVGLSSDSLFASLDTATGVEIDSPVVMCGGSGGPGYSSGTCDGGASYNAAGSGGGSGGSDPISENEVAVEVVSHEVVGPYETVQLSATDPQALETWLSSHGYVIPANVQPIVDEYVAEGFDFLAMRLIPGAGVDAMRPVRITIPGASPVLPLRMVAAGTGAVTAVNLFVVSAGRYEPQNAPTSVIDPADLVWDFDQHRSNYAEARASYFADTGGLGWLTTASFDVGADAFAGLKDQYTAYPTAYGYTDASEATDDIAALTAGNLGQIWLTRLDAQLSQAAFADDLTLGAAGQSPVDNVIQVSDYVGDPCVGAFAGCGDYGGGFSSGSSGTGDGCSTGRAGVTADGRELGIAALGALGLALRVAQRRRRGRRVSPSRC
jgi:hypothetical protein